MDSHILVPRSIFDEFANEHHYFFKYNVETNEISKGFPKSTYTKENYYSDAIEKALNKKIETPLRKLRDFARQIPFAKVIVVDGHLINIAQIYVKSLIARSPVLLNFINQESVFFQFLSQQNKHDFAVSYSMTNLLIDTVISGYDFTFIINNTDITFVIPTRGLYEFSIDGVQCINVPLTPRCALLLKEKGKSILKENNKNAVVIIPKGKENISLCINNAAFEKQKKDGFGYVVTYDKELLKKLKEINKT